MRDKKQECEETISNCKRGCSVMWRWKIGYQRIIHCASEGAGGCGLGGDVQDFDGLYSQVDGLRLPPNGYCGRCCCRCLFGAQRAAVAGATQLQLAVPLVRGLGDRQRGVEPRGVQQEPRPLLNQDLAQKFFAPVKEQAAG